MLRPTTAQQQLRTIRQSLAAIERALKRLGPMRGASSNGTAPPRRLKLSPARRAALKLHGRYLGHMRNLKPRQKAQVKAVKAEKGYHAAIRVAKAMTQR